jgi:hypothetical protein
LTPLDVRAIHDDNRCINQIQPPGKPGSSISKELEMSSTKIDAPWNDGHEAGRKLNWTRPKDAPADKVMFHASAKGFEFTITKVNATKWSWQVEYTASEKPTQPGHAAKASELAKGTASSESGAQASAGYAVALKLRELVAEEKAAEKARAEKKKAEAEAAADDVSKSEEAKDETKATA